MPSATHNTEENELGEGYKALKLAAKVLNEELSSDVFQGIADNQDEMLSNLQRIRQGKIESALRSNQLVSAREVAREILANPDKAVDLIFDDFETVVRWMSSQNANVSADGLKARLSRRRSILEAALPESMRQHFIAAFWAIERNHFGRRYANTETMLGDKIEDISVANLFVSRDKYVFDMHELVTAIRANSGVMRNPLSRTMLPEEDIRFILGHPVGKQLRKLDEDQKRFRRGVGPDTICKIDTLGRTMLADQSMDGGPSREAIDEFLANVAILPSAEEAAIKQLKIPATDKNTGQPFDYTIHESVSDAKDGVTCFHKVSTFHNEYEI